MVNVYLNIVTLGSQTKKEINSKELNVLTVLKALDFGETNA